MPEKKRLLVLASTYPRWRDDVEPGFVHELSRRLTDDFDITVLCPHAKDAKKIEIMDSVHIRRYRYAPASLETLVNGGGIKENLKRNPLKWLLVPIFLLSQLWHTFKYIKRLKPDIIHAHWLFPQGLIAVIASMFNRRIVLVVTSHGSDLYMMRGLMWKPLRFLIASRVRVIAVVGRSMMGYACDQYPGCDVRLLPMGIDFGRFSRMGGDAARVKGRLLYVGRLIESKGLGFLIEAFFRVKEEIPWAHMQVIGEGPCKERFQMQVRNLNLSDSIFFEGSKPNSELPEWYQKCDLFVAPFLKEQDGSQEGLGLVLLEAIGSGCHVVSGAIDAAQDMGIEVVDVRDAVRLSDKILECLSKPYDSRDLLNSKIRIRVEEIYSWDVATSRYRELFNDMA